MDQAPFIAHPENQAVADGSTRRLQEKGPASLLGVLLLGFMLGVLGLAVAITQWLSYAKLHRAATDTVEASALWPAVLLAISLFWLLCCLRWLRPILKHIDDTLAIERRGVVLPGTLLGCREVWSEADTGDVQYMYEFSVDGRSPIRGECWTSTVDLAGRPLPKAGVPVRVFYLDPQRHRML